MLHIILRIKSLFSPKMHLVKPQVISFASFKDPKFPILDLGGGGAGVIGQLYKENVTAIDLRQDELDEAPNGPIKVCADARNLSFEDNSFPSLTAFYFFMYLKPCDYKTVIKEALRVIKEGGLFYIWDTCISKRENGKETLFAIPIVAKLPEKTIQTAYGVIWQNHYLNAELLTNLLEEVGFEIIHKDINGLAIYIECKKKGK